MPEGPEIRRAADRLGRVLIGRKTRNVFFAFDRLKHFETKLCGRCVDRIETRGKAMLIHFEGGDVIYSHNQLYGRWFIRPAGRYPETRRTLRLALETRDNSALLYSASAIDVLAADGLAAHPFLSKVGPDVLAQSLRPTTIAKRLMDKRFRRRQIGALLLDQSFLAGIGNYLRSEILFVAGLHPTLRPVDLPAPALQALARAVRTVSLRAYRKRGVTVHASLATSRRKQGLSRAQSRHYVFARGGKSCPTCSARIAKLGIGGRRCYVCPHCQRDPRVRKTERRGNRSVSYVS